MIVLPSLKDFHRSIEEFIVWFETLGILHGEKYSVLNVRLCRSGGADHTLNRFLETSANHFLGF